MSRPLLFAACLISVTSLAACGEDERHRFDRYGTGVELMPVWWSAIEGRRIPPWPASSKGAPMMGDFSLPPDRRATLKAWIDAGMPEGDPDAAGEPIHIPTVPFERSDVTIEMAVAYSK